MSKELSVVSERKKGLSQEIQTVMVMKEGGEWLFNYSTTKDPMPEDIELLKNFRNHFIEELEKVNKELSKLSEN